MIVDTGLSDEKVDRVFHALADATRRDIVRRTIVGSASVSELAAAYAMSFAAVQKHVTVLEGAGLVTKEPRGRTRIVRAEPEQLDRVRDLLDAYGRLWRGRIDRLDTLLATSDGDTTADADTDTDTTERDTTTHRDTEER